MNLSIWQRQFDGYYEIQCYKGMPLGMLSIGLDELISWPESWLPFLKDSDPNNDEASGDMAYIIKRGDMAYLGYDLLPEYPDQNEFEIPIVELIRLLKEFVELKKSQCPYIILSEKDGKYVIEGKDTLE